MIAYEKQDDIFQSPMQTLICPVNTVSVMGNGLALAFRNRFEGLFPAYQQACMRNVFGTQGFFVFEVSEDRKILCLPTKRDWRNPSKIEWIDQALRSVARNYDEHGITSLAIPAIGCGKGQLEWGMVRGLIHYHLGGLNIPVGVYFP